MVRRKTRLRPAVRFRRAPDCYSYVIFIRHLYETADCVEKLLYSALGPNLGEQNSELLRFRRRHEA